MLILVTGGAASGKSEHAERLVCEKAQSRLYLATMQPFGKVRRGADCAASGASCGKRVRYGRENT